MAQEVFDFTPITAMVPRGLVALVMDQPHRTTNASARPGHKSEYDAVMPIAREHRAKHQDIEVGRHADHQTPHASTGAIGLLMSASQ